jgi:HEPN domain-containing protein
MATIDWVDEVIKEAVIRQAMEFWINPEIERRREAEALPDNFALSAAQVIFNPGADAPEVRLNEEVTAAVQVEVKRDIAKGEEVTAGDISAYKAIVLTEDDPNAGHITIVPHQGSWVLAFDFRRNAAHIGAHVERAREFLDTAAWARQEGKLGPFVDNLFSATELMAKGLLIWMPEESLLKGKSHGLLHQRFNYEGKMENIDPRFPKLLNDLIALRRPARYLARDFSLTEDEMEEMLAVAKDMYAALEASRPLRAPSPGTLS